jgi:hypothetical protein
MLITHIYRGGTARYTESHMKVRTWAFFLSLFLGVFVALPYGAHAATLYIDPFATDVLKGDTVTVAVRLDTDEGECVNAIDAVINYTDGIQAVDVSRGRSILSLWVEDPKIDQGARTITFAGGIPNGYCGRIPGDPSLTNVVAELVFRAPGFSIGMSENSAVSVSFSEQSRVLLNDGTGADAPLRTIPGTINLIQQVGTSTKDAWGEVVDLDETAPQPFGVELVQDPSVFSGKYYIVFNTTDNQSGMDHYEVMEESRDDLYTFRWGRADAPWMTAESPYVLRDQDLRSVIRVRALDKAGNERITVLIPDDAVRPVPLIAWVALALALLLAAGVSGFFAYRYIRRKKALSVPHSNDVLS